MKVMKWSSLNGEMKFFINLAYLCRNIQHPMKEKIKNPFTILIIVFLAGSCYQPTRPAADSDVLLAADRDFSAMSEKEGMNAAFYAFAHDDAVVLHDGRAPLKGKELLKETYWSQADTSIVLTWEPVDADIAASGELGYTYGIYHYDLKDNETGIKGTYVTIWKKDDGGNWKFVLDAGTEGLTEGGL